MSECKWLKVDKTKYTSSISPFIYKRRLSKNHLLQAILDDTIYGFILCDIEPDNNSSLSQKFIKLGWLPVIRRDEIMIDDLSSNMRCRVDKRNFPYSTLIQAMHGEKVLFHTELVKFYLSNGFKITKIYEFYEYEGNHCFQKFYNQLYESRVKATIEKDETKSNVQKLVGNSSYGQTIMVYIYYSYSINKILYRILQNFH